MKRISLLMMFLLGCLVACGAPQGGEPAVQVEVTRRPVESPTPEFTRAVVGGEEAEGTATPEAILEWNELTPTPDVLVTLPPSNGKVATGMTWGVIDSPPIGEATEYDILGAGCWGRPLIGDNQGCDAYQGDTSCIAALPILCVKVEELPRPNYEVTGQAHAMPKEFYRGWLGGFMAATEPVVGLELTSLEVANDMCVKRFGEGWRMASHHDGKYLPDMDLNVYFGDDWVAEENLCTGGWNFYGYGESLPTETRFWVYINGQPGNCWNNGQQIMESPFYGCFE
ncbi:MAG TPA: hypothetical protein VLL52_21630 [Anaerolineae bacterium]|nr:hypothetical protein [Anaerolineae bacterium]